LNVLFVCSQNKLRSPTAEQVFANWPGVEVSSAGLDDGCGNPVTPEALVRILEAKVPPFLRR
jgi:predicted protein tyrosine phosphatase